MNKVRTNLTLDPKTKKEAGKILEELGLDLSTAVSLFLKQVVINNGLPFDISNSKNSIYYKYNQLKDLVEMYFGFDKSKTHTDIKALLSKQDIKQAKQDIKLIKAGKSKLSTYQNFALALKELGIEI